MDITEKKIKINDVDLASLLGFNDQFLSVIESRFDASISVRGDTIIVRGEPSEIKMIEKTFGELRYILQRKGSISLEDVNSVLLFAMPTFTENKAHSKDAPSMNSVILYGKKEAIKPRNKNQAEMYRKVLENDLVFSIGPAGTGKTYGLMQLLDNDPEIIFVILNPK